MPATGNTSEPFSMGPQGLVRVLKMKRSLAGLRYPHLPKLLSRFLGNWLHASSVEEELIRTGRSESICLNLYCKPTYRS